MQRTVHTPDGRLLAVEDCGDAAGRPVLVPHGTSSSRLVIRYGVYVRDVAERGLRLISYDRPGCRFLVAAGPQRRRHCRRCPHEAHLDEERAVFEAMLTGWEWLVRRFTEFAQCYPWAWMPSDVEDFTVSLTSDPDRLALSTIRGYHVANRTARC